MLLEQEEPDQWRQAPEYRDSRIMKAVFHTSGRVLMTSLKLWVSLNIPYHITSKFQKVHQDPKLTNRYVLEDDGRVHFFSRIWGLEKAIGNTVLSQMEHEKLLTRCDPLYEASLSNKHTKIRLKQKKNSCPNSAHSIPCPPECFSV